MPDRVDTLAEQGRALPPEERVRLLDLLLESLGGPQADAVDDPWDLEIARRVAAHECGEGTLFEWDEVLAQAKHIAP